MDIHINGKPVKSVTLERILGLPIGTIETSLGNDPCLGTLIKIVQTFPWLLDVAESHYNEKEAKKILIRTGAELACQQIDGKK
jgi:hypothetical protein